MYIKKDLEKLKGFSEAEKHNQIEKLQAENRALTIKKDLVTRQFAEAMTSGLILDTVIILTLILVAIFSTYDKTALVLIAALIIAIKHGIILFNIWRD